MTSATRYPAKVSLTLTFNGKITLLTVLVLPVLVSLGLWQLERADEKRQLQVAFFDQQRLPPVALEHHTREQINQLANYTRVILEGNFDNAHTWLVDNKLRRGRVGYEVVTPFRLPQGGTVLVNRGWIPAGKRRDQLPEIPQVEHAVTLFASVYRPTDNSFLEAQPENDTWPQVIVELDPNTASKTLGTDVMNMQLRLDETSAAALTTEWTFINNSPEKHTGYAVQWFAMSLALVLWFFFANTNLVAFIRDLKATKKQKTEY